MLVIFTLIGLLLAFFSVAKFNKIINPASLIVMWYFSFIWLSRCGFYSMYVPSVQSSALLMINIDLLVFVFLLFSKNGNVTLYAADYLQAKENQNNLFGNQGWLNQLRFIIEVICLFTILAVNINIFIKLLTGGLPIAQIRYALMFQDASSNFNANFLYFNSTIRDFLTYFVRFFVFLIYLLKFVNLVFYEPQ